MNFTLALKTIEFLGNETDYIPWVAALNNLAYIGERFTANNIGIFRVNIYRAGANLSETD